MTSYFKALNFKSNQYLKKKKKRNPISEDKMKIFQFKLKKKKKIKTCEIKTRKKSHNIYDI